MSKISCRDERQKKLRLFSLFPYGLKFTFFVSWTFLANDKPEYDVGMEKMTVKKEHSKGEYNTDTKRGTHNKRDFCWQKIASITNVHQFF